jgi:uncharacterized membrane protein
MSKYLIVFFLSMVPILELRFAVPFAVGMDLPYIPALITCVIGNMVPVPFIYLFARKFLIWGAKQKYIGKFCAKFLEKGEKAGRKIVAATGRGGTFLALMLFVGIPVPGTGAWTGTLAASLLDLGPKTTAAAVSLGVIMAGVIMAIASGSVFHIVGL